MVICVVADVLGEPNNGTTLAALNLIKYLKSRSHEVRVLCGDEDKKDEEGFFIVKNMDLGHAANRYLEKNGVAVAKPDLPTIETALDGVDVCHIMTPFSLARAALKVCLERNIPVTAGFHCQAENISAHIKGMMNDKLLNRTIYLEFYRHFYRYVDAIHYPTGFIRDTFERAVRRKTNGYVISNGVNDIFKKTDAARHPYRILFTGRFSKEKSHDTLLEAVARSRYRDKIELVLAGSGPREEHIRKKIEKLGLERVEMKFFTREELVGVINSSTLYVHPAKIEIEAISCLEAIRCGLVPVISDSKRSATGAFALGEENLFRCGDPKDLAAKIDYWFDHPERIAECSEKYLGFTERFSQEKCMERMEEMLAEVSKKH